MATTSIASNTELSPYCTHPNCHIEGYAGRIEDAEMSRTFNMGIGMVLVVTEEASRKILEEGQLKAYRIGEVVCGEGVRYC
ncbi:hypothetical protein NC651_032303 [Populus alba x Populus x berolinensis]|nr:hypothetical protein NC651_032303 [Populus alba x Populus x berolinensis]